jgi:general secretion pathway protein A
MYERFFGLRERPFDLTPNPRFLVMTDGHREALSNLEYAIAARKGITLLLGEAGCGKTTLIRAAIERQPARVHCVHLTNPALTRHEFVETLGTRFALSPEARVSKATLLRELEDLLRHRRKADETTVVVIDEAQSLSNDLLEEIRLLANIETADDKLLSLILAGQPELAGQLDQGALRQLKQRVALRCELRPLTTQETLSYLAGRVRAAGGVASRIFTREAAASLHEHSGGIPRVLNVLADNSLLAAFGKQSTQVTSQFVADVARDFHLVARAETPPSQADTGSPASLLVAVSPSGVTEAAVPGHEESGSSPRNSVLFGTFLAGRRFPFFLGRRDTA